MWGICATKCANTAMWMQVPTEREIMTRETMQQCLDVIKTTGAHTLDLTGGAPEMNQISVGLSKKPVKQG